MVLSHYGGGSFSIGSLTAFVGSFRDRLPGRGDEGILDLAAVEDKALLRSNLSAAAVHWHSDAAPAGRRPLPPTMLLAQSDKGFPNAIHRVWEPNLRGLGTESPTGTEVRQNRMSHKRDRAIILSETLWDPCDQ